MEEGLMAPYIEYFADPTGYQLKIFDFINKGMLTAAAVLISEEAEAVHEHYLAWALNNKGRQTYYQLKDLL
jgi:hypothetical protein